jgi:hypothetical protein
MQFCSRRILLRRCKAPQDMVVRLQFVDFEAAVASLAIDRVHPVPPLGPFILHSVDLSEKSRLAAAGLSEAGQRRGSQQAANGHSTVPRNGRTTRLTAVAEVDGNGNAKGCLRVLRGTFRRTFQVMGDFASFALVEQKNRCQHDRQECRQLPPTSAAASTFGIVRSGFLRVDWVLGHEIKIQLVRRGTSPVVSPLCFRPAPSRRSAVS